MYPKFRYLKISPSFFHEISLFSREPRPCDFRPPSLLSRKAGRFCSESNAAIFFTLPPVSFYQSGSDREAGPLPGEEVIQAEVRLVDGSGEGDVPNLGAGNCGLGNGAINLVPFFVVLILDPVNLLIPTPPPQTHLSHFLPRECTVNKPSANNCTVSKLRSVLNKCRTPGPSKPRL